MRALILPLTALIFFFTISNAYAVPVTKYNMINIVLSETCVKMNQNNIPGCPHVKDLKGFDNSNQAISGKLLDDSRAKPQLKNHYMWYQGYNIPVVCVDCSVDFYRLGLVQSIIIEPHDFTWTAKDVTQNTRVFTQNHGRYMDGCQSATLAYNWNLMTDTIYYMRNACNPDATDYNGTTKYTLSSTPIDYGIAPQYQYDKWLADSKKNNISNCINHDCPIVKNPQKKW